MALPKRIYNEVKSNIEKGVFKTIALIQMQNAQRHSMFGHSKQGTKECLARLDFINEFTMEPGDYELECRQNYNTKTAVKIYKFTIGKTITIPIVAGKPNDANKSEPLNVEAEHMPEQITLDEYRRLLEENATLSAGCQLWEQKYKLMQDRYEEQLADRRQLGLADGSSRSSDDRWLNIAEQLMPAVGALAQEFFSGKENDRPAKRVKRHKAKEPAVYKGHTYTELLTELDRMPDDELNEELEEIHNTNPALAAQLENDLGFEDEEEEPGQDTPGAGEEEVA